MQPLKRIKSIIVVGLILLISPDILFSRTWYVKSDGTGDVPTIQAAVDTAGLGDVILVAAGRYTWSNQGSSGDYGMILYYRDVTGFELRSESGTEVTILDAENQGRVFYIMAYNDITIDGFTVTGGRAPNSYNAGGGLIGHLSAPTIRNCTFTENTAEQGGGLWYGGVSAPIIENCLFSLNSASYGGGVCLVNSSTSAHIDNCTIRDNTASLKGGGVLAYNYAFDLENCSIYRNSAVNEGGGLHCQKIYPSTVGNCTFSENSAADGGGIYLFWESDLVVRNCIIANSTEGGALTIDLDSSLDIGCCDIFGNLGGDSLPSGAIDSGWNIFLDPQFCGMKGSGNYFLQSDSPCHPINHPDGLFCGLIGAHPVMCGTIQAGDNTWGKIKNLKKK